MQTGEVPKHRRQGGAGMDPRWRLIGCRACLSIVGNIGAVKDEEAGMDRDELRRIAAACGLPKLEEPHLDQLA